MDQQHPLRTLRRGVSVGAAVLVGRLCAHRPLRERELPRVPALPKRRMRARVGSHRVLFGPRVLRRRVRGALRDQLLSDLQLQLGRVV